MNLVDTKHDSEVISQKTNTLLSNFPNKDDLKYHVTTNVTGKHLTVVDILPLVCAGSYIALGLLPRVEQIQAVLQLHKGDVVEQDTGEGKTLVVALLACVNYLETGKKTHVVTSSEYLSIRDFTLMSPLFDLFAVKTSNPNSADTINTRIDKCKNSDIVYSTIPALIHDLMYHQYYFFSEDYLGRDSLIVDEADATLLDQAIAPFRLNKVEKIDLTSFVDNIFVLKKLITSSDVSIDIVNNTCILNQKGESKLASTQGIDFTSVVGGLSLGVFLKNFFLKTEGIHYNINESQVTNSTLQGSINAESPLQVEDILCLKIKHGIELDENIKEVSVTSMVNQMTFSEFTSYYETVCGLTATAEVHRKEFKELYNLNVSSVPRSFKLDRTEMSPMLFFNNNEKNRELLNIIEKEKESAIIIACSTHEQGDSVSSFLTENNIHNFYVKTTLSDGDVPAGELGKPGSVTVVTPSFSRGVDIVPDELTNYMTLIFMNTMPTRKIEYQMKGRIARQGSKGVVYKLISTEDSGVEFNVKVEKNLGVDRISKFIERQLVKKQDVTMEAEFIARKGLDSRTDLLETGRFIWLQYKEDLKHSENFEDLVQTINRLSTKSSGDVLFNKIKEFDNEYQLKVLPKIISLLGGSCNKAWGSFLNKTQNFNELNTLLSIGQVDSANYYDYFNKESLNFLASSLRKEINLMVNFIKFE